MAFVSSFPYPGTVSVSVSSSAGAGRNRAECWLSALCCSVPYDSCHLHSTDTPEFCEAPETVGSAKVSMTAAVSELEDGEEEDDEPAVAFSRSFFFMRFRLLSMDATSDLSRR